MCIICEKVLLLLFHLSLTATHNCSLLTPGHHKASFGSQHCAPPWGMTELPPRHHCMLILGQHYASSGAPTDTCTRHHFTLCPGHHSTRSGHHCAHCSTPLVGSVWGSTLCWPQGRTGCGVGLSCQPRHTAHDPFLSRDKPSSWWGGTSGEPGLLIFKLIHLWGTPSGKLGRPIRSRGESGMLRYPIEAIHTAINTSWAPRAPWATLLATIGKHGLQLPLIYCRLRG